jgi:hypothetical protein
MTREDIIHMAREAGCFHATHYWPIEIEFLERFATLVAAAEREECAKLCEETELAFDIAMWCDSTKKEMTAHTARGLVKAIRARSEA